MLLQTVKVYLGINDELQDTLLQQIIDDMTQEVTDYISEETLPTKLERIVRELTIIRYNRIGSEGTKTDSEEGKSATYVDDPFQKFVPALDKYIEDNLKPPIKGKAKFL